MRISDWSSDVCSSDLQLCATGAWRFHERRLDTAVEVSCTFDKIDKVPGGYDITATCLAEGNRTPDTIELRFAESARAMLVSSKMWDGVGLSQDRKSTRLNSSH